MAALRHWINRFALAWLASLLACGLAWADDPPVLTWDSEAGNSLFNLPRDWTRSERDGATILSAPGVPPGEKVVIILGPGRKLEDDFRKTFIAELNAAAGDARAVGGQIKGTKADEGYPVFFCDQITTDAAGKKQYRWFLASNPGDQFEMVMYAASTLELYRRFQGDMDEFVRTLSYKNVQPGPVTLTPRRQAIAVDPSRDLDGLYVASRSRQQLNVMTNTYETRMWIEHLLFLPGGRVFSGPPSAGARGSVDYESARRQFPEKCGLYRIDGDKIVLDWPQRRGFETGVPLAFARNDKGIKLADQQYLKVTFETGATFDGTFAARSFVNTSGGGNAGNVSGERRITFRKDGTFEKEGFVGLTTGGGGGQGAAVSQTQARRGRYTIEPGQLRLDFDDGSTETFGFYRFPGEEDTVIVIDGISFLRRE